MRLPCVLDVAPSGWADWGHDQVMRDPFFHDKSPLKHHLGDDFLFLSKHLEQNIGYFAFLALLGELIHHEDFSGLNQTR